MHHSLLIHQSPECNRSAVQVTDVNGDVGSFDVISETLRATNLGQLRSDSEVNFERSGYTFALCCCFSSSANTIRIQVDVSPVTTKCVIFGDCRSAKVGDEIGGHNVSGHVHTTATVSSVEDTENNKRVTFQVMSQPLPN